MEDFDCEKSSVRSSPMFHRISKIPPNLLLSKMFQTFGCFCRGVGIFPITLHPDGRASYSFLSKPMIHTLVYIVLFLGASSFYVPAYLKQNSKFIGGDVAIYIAENLFVGGQVFGVLFTFGQIPRFTRGLVGVWNGLALIVEMLANKGQVRYFIEPYVRSRAALIGHILFMIVYALIWWRDFTKKSPERETLINNVFIISFFILCYFHLFPCMMFRMLANVITRSYVGVGALLKEQEGQLRKNEGGELLGELIQTMEQLRQLTKQLGEAMGFYLLVEMVVFMTSILMNVFTMLTKFQQRDASTTGLCFISYAVLVVVVTEGGEALQKEGALCQEQLRAFVFLGGGGTTPTPLLLHKVTSMKRPKVSASGFFDIDRKLTVAMASTFATYFVVMIQFKLNAVALESSQG